MCHLVLLLSSHIFTSSKLSPRFRPFYCLFKTDLFTLYTNSDTIWLGYTTNSYCLDNRFYSADLQITCGLATLKSVHRPVFFFFFFSPAIVKGANKIKTAGYWIERVRAHEVR